jgi:hypothetical protein
MLRIKEQHFEKLFSMKLSICIGEKKVSRDDPSLRHVFKVIGVIF